MAFEDIKAEIERLVGETAQRPHDKHEFYLDLHEKLNEMRAMGMPVPDDLLQLERKLEVEFALQKPSKNQHTF